MNRTEVFLMFCLMHAGFAYATGDWDEFAWVCSSIALALFAHWSFNE